MRKETAKIAAAFHRGLPAKAARTETDGREVYLHGHRIAWREPDGRICLTLAGWGTVTTRERLNGILDTFGLGRRWRFTQRGGVQCIQTWNDATSAAILLPVDERRDVARFDPRDVYRAPEISPMGPSYERVSSSDQPPEGEPEEDEPRIHAQTSDHGNATVWVWDGKRWAEVSLVV